MIDLAPHYSFDSDVLPTTPALPLEQGQVQCIHFTVLEPDETLSSLLNKIRLWFSQRDEVLLVDHGTTAKGLGYVVMEWEGFAIDPLFLAILTHEEIIDDYTIYTRDEEAYQ